MVENIVMMDCDGVINNDDAITSWISEHGDSKESMEQFKQRHCVHNGHDGYVVPELAERMKWICLESNCRIVWSSSWRENYWTMDRDSGEGRFDWHAIAALWRAKGLPLDFLIGCTPCIDMSRFSYVPRGVEIQKWIDENARRYNIRHVAILDDNEDAAVGVEFDGAKYFQTSFTHGLTKDIAKSVVEFLKGE